jgi:RimJ/RimL family protein N-acetyltransferase
MISPMILKTERLSLSPLRSSDAPALFAILGDAEAMKFWDRPAIARTATATEIVASQLAAMEDGHFLYWTVRRDNDAIGSVDLSALDFTHLRGEIGFLFRRDQWGQGYGREAMRAVIDHAFGQLKLQRLEARVHAANAPAKKLIRLLGFEPEGRLSGYVLRDGGRHDVDVFGLLSAQALRH